MPLDRSDNRKLRDEQSHNLHALRKLWARNVFRTKEMRNADNNIIRKHAKLTT
jgi:hypothetical protein